MRRFLRDNGLSLVAFALFAVALVGQGIAGYYHHLDEELAHEDSPPSVGAYLASGHFLESVFENWESEFLQMALFVILTAMLVQRGSAESRKPHVEELRSEDEEERLTPRDRARVDAPWPVRVGGPAEKLYSHSLSLALGVLFVFSFVLHAVTGYEAWRADQLQHGQHVGSVITYVTGPRFWFESFQNWQSEFLAVGALIVLTIFLRERGSPQSKPVGASHAQTGPE